MKEVLFVILDKYADWEAAHIAAALNDSRNGMPKYAVKTVSLNRSPVSSIGGFNVIPDYDIDSVPEDFAAVLLIGGYSWRRPEAGRVAELVARARERGVPVGAICDATVFLGMHGFLNEVRHTSNMLSVLKEAAGDRYTGESRYLMQQAVSDGGIITANGTAHLEFAREVLSALEAMPSDKIDEWYHFYKLGFYEAFKRRGPG